MLGIQSYTNEILKYLPALGLTSYQVSLNPRTADGLTALIQVGGEKIFATHGYVIMEGNLPVIPCLDPNTVRREKINEMWIAHAISKAKQISKEGYQKPNVVITISPSLSDVFTFLDANESAPWSIDLECDPTNHEITAIAFAYESAGTVYSISIPFAHESFSYWTPTEERIVWTKIAEVLSGSDPKIFQNYIFDTMILSYYGLRTNGTLFDTMIAAHWIQPEIPKSLHDLGRLYLVCEPWKYAIESYVSNPQLWEYNAKDAAYTLLILNNQLEVLRNERRLKFFTDHLVPLSTEVLRICEKGWVLDTRGIQDIRDSLTPQIESLLNTMRDSAKDFIRPKVTRVQRRGKPKPEATYEVCAGGAYQRIDIPADLKWLRDYPQQPVYERTEKLIEFNPGSPPQLGSLIEALGYKLPVSRATGKKTTGKDALITLRNKHPEEPLFDRVLSYRGMEKMVSTYCDAQADFDGRYRFSIIISGAKEDELDTFGGGGTVTSRFSSKQTPWGTGFNCQNIPKSFRKVILPHYPEWKIVNLDFKAADPHMVAWLSGEKKMLDILSSPKGDLHAFTASGIYGYDITKELGYDKDTSYKRKVGKACNNGLNYGMQATKFQTTCRLQGLILSADEARRAHDQYFKLYPGIQAWQQDIFQRLVRTRTLTTPLGRRRYFYGHLDSSNKLFHDALAYIPPTTVADALNIGWLRFVRQAKELGLRAEVIQQCHDSLCLQVHEDDIDPTCKLLLQCYKEVVFFIGSQECNFPVEIGVGPNAGELTTWSPS